MMADKNATIIRSPKNRDNPYTLTLRETAQDSELSWEARGILWYLLSKPDTWEARVEDLERAGCKSGRVKRVLRELIKAGYMQPRTRYRDDDGSEWKYTPYTYADEPLWEDEYADTPLDEIQLCVFRVVENRTFEKRTLIDNRDSERIESKDSLGSGKEPEPRRAASNSDFVPKQKPIPYTGHEAMDNHRAMLETKTVPVYQGDDELKLQLEPETAGGINLSSENGVEPNQSSAAAPDGWQRIDDGECSECANDAAWVQGGRLYCDWHYSELAQGVEVSGVSEKPKRKRKGKQLANDERVEVLGLAWGVEAQGDDYAFYLKLAKALNKAGIENSEFEKYVKHWRKEFKDKDYNKGELTLPSLTAKGRPSEYVAQRDKQPAETIAVYDPENDEAYKT